MKPSCEISVVIISYNTRDLLLECLSSVIEGTHTAKVEVIVVDNASTDGSYEAVRQTFPQVVAIANTTNLGFGAACNQAIRATRSPLILLLNSDARLTQQAFQSLRDCMQRNDRCAAAGCRVVNNEGQDVVNTRNFLTPLNQVLEHTGITKMIRSRYLCRTYKILPDRNLFDCTVDWVDGACLMLRRAALVEVGLFDEQFFMYEEEEDLCFRLRERGWLICHTSAGTVVHHGGASSRQNKGIMLRHFYLSQMIFLAKHYGHVAVFLFVTAMKLVLLLKCLLLLLLTRSEGYKDFAEQFSAVKSAYLTYRDSPVFRSGIIPRLDSES